MGLEFGSFANVCIYRWPRRLSVLKPLRSQCPWCQAQIAWWQNIPIISFFLLQFKCRNCNSPISWRYPIVELLLPNLWLMTWFSGQTIIIGNFPFLLLLALFNFVLLVSTFTDLDWRIIPDECTLFLLMIGLILSPWNYFFGASFDFQSLLLAGAGAVTGVLPMYFLSHVGVWGFGKDGMGGGDIKLMAGVGAVLGWKGALGTLMIASLLGSVFILIGLLMKIIRRKQYIPFGPFLCAGAFVEMIFMLQGFSGCDILKKIP